MIVGLSGKSSKSFRQRLRKISLMSPLTLSLLSRNFLPWSSPSTSRPWLARVSARYQWAFRFDIVVAEDLLVDGDGVVQQAGLAILGRGVEEMLDGTAGSPRPSGTGRPAR